MTQKKLIVFIDSGDTIMDESTEIRDEKGIVCEAKMIQGAEQMLQTLHESGYRMALVADGNYQSFENVYTAHNLKNYFETLVYSEIVGEEKPSAAMFETAMSELNLTKEDVSRIVMIGNNIERDIVGANKLGITSILQTWSPRYRYTVENEWEQPDYEVSDPSELVGLIEQLNQNLE